MHNDDCLAKYLQLDITVLQLITYDPYNYPVNYMIHYYWALASYACCSDSTQKAS